MRRALALAALLLAAVGHGDIRTYPPSGVGGIAGGSGPFPDEGALHYVFATEMEAGTPLGPAVTQKINNNGEIVGWFLIGADAQPAIYRSGAWVDLGPLAPYTIGASFGISPSGATAGFSFVSLPGPDNNWISHYSVSGGTTVINDGGPGEGVGDIPPDSFSYAILDNLDRVGCLTRYDDLFPDPNRAFKFVHGTSTLIDLHALIAAIPLSDFTCARDINLSGNVVGEYQPSFAAPRGWLYTDSGGTITILQLDASNYLSNARAMNDSNMIVGEGRKTGYTADFSLKWEAGVLTSDGSREWVGPNSPAFNSRPNDVDAHGHTCGMLFKGDGEYAYISIDNVAIVLNTLVISPSTVVLGECLGMNDLHQMVTRGYDTGTPATTRYYYVTVAP